MSSYKYLFLKGKAKGRLSAIYGYTTGDMKVSHMHIEALDLFSLERIDEIDLDRKKIGLYHRPSRGVINARLFIEEDRFIRKDLNNLILNDLILGEKINIEGQDNWRFSSDVILKVRRTSESEGYEPIDDPDTSVGGEHGILEESVNEPGSNGPPPPPPPGKPWITESRKSCLGQIIGGVLGYFFLSWLFGSTGLFVPLLIILGIYGLLNYFIKRGGWGNGFRNRHSWFNILGWLMLFYSLYALYNSGYSFVSLMILGIGLGLILGSRESNLFRSIGKFISFVCLCALVYLYSDFNFEFDYFDDDQKKHSYQEDDEFVEDGFEIESDSVTNKNGDAEQLKYLTHKLNWKDNKSKNYSSTFRVRKDFYHLSRLARKRIEPSQASFTGYYREVYQNLLIQDRGYLKDILSMYLSIGKSQKLNRKAFADMIVTSIQNIPYYLVHELSHQEADRQFGGFVSQYHRSGGPCLDKIKFGIQSPTEFMGNFKGDCDTRSVLLYYVLSEFGYKVMVLGSERYSHAILAISGNYRGLHKRSKGIKYYAWETTATGYVPGTLSPDCNDMNYWKVVLKN